MFALFPCLTSDGGESMRLNYNGKDITQSIEIYSCKYRDAAGGRSDGLEISFNDAAAWHDWNPEQNDVLQAQEGGYKTGKMFVNAIMPEDGKYRMLATGVPTSGTNKRNRTYKNMSFSGIIASCAAECGLISSRYGMDETYKYEYIERNDMSGAAFADWLIGNEGGMLKTINGHFIAIGLAYAQERSAIQEMELRPDMSNLTYQRRNDKRISDLIIKTPHFTATAHDTTVKEYKPVTVCDLPIFTAAQAGRWARAMLANHNRQCEEINIESEFNPALTALARIDIQSKTEMAGEWIVDQVEHDLIERKSSARLLRCIKGIR